MRRTAAGTALFALAALFAAGSASAVVWRHDARAELALEAARAFSAVGRVTPDGTATLIAPTWALTAAHVATRVARDGGAVEFQGRRYAVKRAVIHPQGHADPAHPRQPPEVDLGLLELTEPVAGLTPIGVYRGRDELGQTAHIVGYGDFGPAGASLARADGKRRGVVNTIADAGPLRLFLPFDAPPGGLALEGIGAPGDSGGPALLYEDGAPWIAGVSSGADGPAGAYGSTDVYVRVSTHLPWIEETLRGVDPR